jgi:hypothetical protein
MLQRAAMRHYGERDMRKAIETALQGYVLISAITSSCSGAELGQALHAHAPDMHDACMQGARRDVDACRSCISADDNKSLMSFAEDLADARRMLAYSGVFRIFVMMDARTEVGTCLYPVESPHRLVDPHMRPASRAQAALTRFQGQLEAKYERVQPSLQTIFLYMLTHGEARYFLVWMEAMRLPRRMHEDETAAKLHRARTDLKAYWRSINFYYKDGTLPSPRAEFLSGRMVCSRLLPRPSPCNECSGVHHWLCAFRTPLLIHCTT